MELYEKFGYFVLGMVIGYILGRLVRTVHEIKEELDEVDDIVKKRARDESGFMRFPIVADIALVVVIAVTVWAAVATGHTNYTLKETQDDLEVAQSQLKSAQADISELGECNQKFLGVVIRTLNARTISVQERADANAALQKAQAKFIRIILTQPPVTDDEARAALERYSELLNEFVAASEEAKSNSEEFPYPTDEELAKCYSDAE